MPNAPRNYRNGIHEGVDFYDSDNCTGITRGTPVLAAKAGTVIRADLNYTDITAADVAKYQANPNNEEALDNFRGRQVWVDHGIDASGVRIVTRYCHLSAIAAGITVGTQVAKGQVIAAVGESGTPESVIRPGSEYHLHLEIRTGDSFLGKGLPASQVRALYAAAFSQ
jgi:murein DD-endopeptidase MepM/ murein hydrolase activator NlpD